MSTYFKFFSLSLFLIFTLSSCGGDDEVSLNDTTKDTLIGEWRSTTATIDEVDMSNSVFATFNFADDGTYTSNVSEGGFGLALSGSYSVTEEGTLLSFFDNTSSFGIAGNADHVLSNVTESTFTITLVSTSTDRVIDFIRI